MFRYSYLLYAFCICIITSCRKDVVNDSDLKCTPKNFVANDAVLITDATNLIVVGTTRSNASDENISIQKIDVLSGSIKWSTIIGGAGTDGGYRIIETTDGYLIGGLSNSAPALGFDINIVKIDQAGSVVWNQVYGGGGTESIGNISVHSNGTIFVSGTTTSYGAGDRDLIIYKLDALGTEIFHKTFGGVLADGAADLISIQDDLYAYGYTNNFGHGDRDLWLLRVDANLDTVWTRTIGTVEYEEPGRLHMSNDQKLLFCGHSGTFPMHSGFLGKYDLQGNLLFEKYYGSVDHDGLEDCMQASDNSIYGVGYSSSFGNAEQAYVVHADAEGSLLSSAIYGDGSNQRFYKVLEDSKDIYLIGNSEDKDAYIKKIKK